MELKEILRAMLFITTAVSFGISILSFFTFIKLKKVPKKERNLMEFQKVNQYVKLGQVSLGIAAAALLVALWLSS
ncbi:hypothetical protein [Proteiniclasticum ruminis]|uniref:Uncharacterized protein n=1 Tax=Proteiniclasticum ruminis TaxID=398199 RepID=A0A1G8M7E3_9CLOT|nr:hypothetical protein [Proteiniclasticum ruminis]SDI63757.1 hypothetical protein SAMN05421804_103304 [Proteiniclasticum ruminis]